MFRISLVICSLLLIGIESKKYIFRRSSNPVLYSDNDCNTTVLWMTSNESQDIDKLTLHSDVCQMLPRDVTSMKNVPIDEEALTKLNEDERPGFYSLISFYDLNYLLNIGSLSKFTEKQTRFFIIREAIGPFRIIAMIYDNRNLRLNLINPEDTLSAIRPKQIACVMSTCPFYQGNESCFLPNIKDKLKMSHILMSEEYPSGAVSSRLTIYQVQAIVLGFLCIVFGLACVLFCVYAFKTTKYQNQISNSKMMINNLKASPAFTAKPTQGDTINFMQLPKSNSFAVLKALNGNHFDENLFHNNYENRQSLVIKTNPSDDTFLRNNTFTPNVLSMPASRSMQFFQPRNNPNTFNMQSATTLLPGQNNATNTLQTSRPKSIIKLSTEEKNLTKDFMVPWSATNNNSNPEY